MSNDNINRVALTAPSESVPPAERSGPAIINLLQQAADVARRNEERAKAMALRLTDELRTLEQQNQSLEQRARTAEERAARAEQWLLHIYDEIHVQLIEQAPSIASNGEGDRSRRMA